MSTWTTDHQARLPPEASIRSVAGSPWLPPSHLATQCTRVCGVWKSSSPASSLSREAQAIPPMVMADESLSMVFELGDKGSLQWHLGSVLGGEQQGYLLQSLQLSILEWWLELLLDLLLALDAFLWLLHAVPHLPSW